MLRLPLLTAALLLIPASAAFAKPLTVAVPAEAQSAVTVAKGVQAVSVKSAPKGVIVVGGVKHGRLAVAVARPRGAAAGKVVLAVKGRAKLVRSASACKDLAGLLARGLKGPAARGLGAVLAARTCGRPDPAGAAALLARLGLGPAPGGGAPALGTPPPAAGTGGGTILQRPGGGPAPGGGNVCANGVDDDGDGQVDFSGTRPDPGCTSAADTTETGEVAVSAECASSSGVGVGDDQQALFAGINAGCGQFTQVTVNVAPAVASCEAFTSDHSFTCAVAGGLARASGPATHLVDITLALTGEVKCSVPATIALTRPGGEVAELVEPVGGDCGLVAVKPQCANGVDDDGDGTADARDAAGATDPDPGCSGTTDTTEGSDGDLPEGCDVSVDAFQEDPRFTYLVATGCGALQGVWFKPPGVPTDCAYKLGAAAAQTCSVTGRTAGATFAPTTDQVILATHVAAAPACVPVTVALTLAGGAVVSGRGNWC